MGEKEENGEKFLKIQIIEKKLNGRKGCKKPQIINISKNRENRKDKGFCVGENS
jgi:hypothetical protein